MDFCKDVNKAALINNWSHWLLRLLNWRRNRLKKPTRGKGNGGTRLQAMLEWMWVRICGINWLEVRVVRITQRSTNQGPVERSVYHSTEWGTLNLTALNTQTITAECCHIIPDSYSADRTVIWFSLCWLCTPAHWKWNNDCGVKALTFSFKLRLYEHPSQVKCDL